MEKKTKLIMIFLLIKKILLVIIAHLIVTGQSAMMRLKVFGKSPKIHFEQPYQAQKILLLALYQKGRLRPDIENLLTKAKQLGMYVLAINNLKVLDPNSLKEKIDCYIERPNFGRDFGCYKTGFLHLLKQGWEKQIPRLLMLNDGLFYSKQNLAAFLCQMTNTDIEVLGATENFEKHHLGSFCISLQASILQHPHFKNFWKHYTNSDIRTKVIEYGEIKLSKTLRSCVSSEDQFQSLYNLNWLLNYLNNNKEILDYIYDFSRDSEIIAWPTMSLKKVIQKIKKKYFLFRGLDEDSNKQNTIFKTNDLICQNIKDYIEITKISIKKINLQKFTKIAYDEVKNNLVDCFVIGSQLHQNNILLHHLGLPIIKLDGLYRGVLSIADVIKLANQLSQDEKQCLQKLMFNKYFGGATLVGWKRAAFFQGLI